MDGASGAAEDGGAVVFYDGQCGLCARSVRWILKRDRLGVFRFAPLQGSTFASLVERGDVAGELRDVDSLIVRTQEGATGRTLVRSDAVLAVLRRLGWRWRALAAVGALFPKALRDAAYRFVARRRLRLFGGAEACALPSPEQRARLLP